MLYTEAQLRVTGEFGILRITGHWVQWHSRWSCRVGWPFPIPKWWLHFWFFYLGASLILMHAGWQQVMAPEATPLGIPERVLGSWLWSGSVLKFAGIWKMNQWVTFFFSLHLLFHHLIKRKQINIWKRIVAGIVLRQAKLLPVVFHFVWACSLIFASNPDKAGEGDLSIWALVTHVGNPDSFWLLPIPAFAILTFWRINLN